MTYRVTFEQVLQTGFLQVVDVAFLVLGPTIDSIQFRASSWHSCLHRPNGFPAKIKGVEHVATKLLVEVRAAEHIRPARDYELITEAARKVGAHIPQRAKWIGALPGCVRVDGFALMSALTRSSLFRKHKRSLTLPVPAIWQSCTWQGVLGKCRWPCWLDRKYSNKSCWQY